MIDDDRIVLLIWILAAWLVWFLWKAAKQARRPKTCGACRYCIPYSSVSEKGNCTRLPYRPVHGTGDEAVRPVVFVKWFGCGEGEVK